MSPQRALGIILLMIGVVLLVMGTTWYILGGTALGVLGLILILFGVRGKRLLASNWETFRK